MGFASNSIGMLYFASGVALATAAAGCVTTNPVEFSSEENFPPSVVSQLNADYPLREIGQLNLDAPVEIPELPLEVIVRDPNVSQTLEYRIFLNSENPPGAELPVRQGEISPDGGFVEREETFTIPYSSLRPGECNKIELVVVGEFASFVEPRRPVEEGDFDNATWWVEVTSTDRPTIDVGCR